MSSDLRRIERGATTLERLETGQADRIRLWDIDDHPPADQIADKICAMYELYGVVAQRSSGRYRDLVDLLLISMFLSIDLAETAEAVERERVHRGIEALPAVLVSPGPDWENDWRREALRSPLPPDHHSLEAGLQAAGYCYHRVLGALTATNRSSRWNPDRTIWEDYWSGRAPRRAQKTIVFRTHPSAMALTLVNEMTELTRTGTTPALEDRPQPLHAATNIRSRHCLVLDRSGRVRIRRPLGTRRMTQPAAARTADPVMKPAGRCASPRSGLGTGKHVGTLFLDEVEQPDHPTVRRSRRSTPRPESPFAVVLAIRIGVAPPVRLTVLSIRCRTDQPDRRQPCESPGHHPSRRRSHPPDPIGGSRSGGLRTALESAVAGLAAGGLTTGARTLRAGRGL
ncbi:nucleotidyl transferase AbiEii/AbiGii toxin family protein [Nocardia otitidiscaviarum]|uniref:nucleotidyl transferase AbiEii/AbiGii toxin family protein n=1 Tax=Nocardia otitidiscaviarum TaxID=1823 RepID=UPI002454AED5|nr:nucleotidyl transferase AbiEii/AbiGii toxin family protein [Nocardia otitidiscaviarum]